ncbi:MAG: LamG domain-containing protein [Saprospiraceae bacterium]|nr:LamG domain-containing protein [Saprospiraceae bacterium]
MKNLFLLFLSGVLILGLSITSCKDKDTDLPAIGGFNNANEVGATNLLAYWPLNGNGIENKSGTNPSDIANVTWVDAVKGKGAKFDSGWLDYPQISALSTNTTGNISISAWVKISNTKVHPDSASNISPIFSLSRPGFGMGNVNLFGNTHELTTSDSIQMKAEFHFKKADGTEFGGDCLNMIRRETWMDSTHTVAANKIGGIWAHVVYVYDGATANNRLYVNGVKISNSAWESRNGGAALPMDYFTPTRPIIGALANEVDGTNQDAWNRALKGEIDEIRVWKSVLSAAEIDALYQLEKAGR